MGQCIPPPRHVLPVSRHGSGITILLHYCCSQIYKTAFCAYLLLRQYDCHYFFYSATYVGEIKSIKKTELSFFRRTVYARDGLTCSDVPALQFNRLYIDVIRR